MRGEADVVKATELQARVWPGGVVPTGANGLRGGESAHAGEER